MHTTREHHLKEEKHLYQAGSLISHEIHTLPANIDPSEQELREFHCFSQAGALSSSRQRGKGEKLPGEKDLEHRLDRLERKDT